METEAIAAETPTFETQEAYEQWRATGKTPEVSENSTPNENSPGEKSPELVESKDDEHQSAEKSGEKSDDGDEEAGEQKHKRRGGFQRKIERLEAEIAALKSGQPPSPEAKAAPKVDGKPTLDQFDSVEAFTEALTDWKLEQHTKAQAAKQAEAQTATEWQKKLDAARGKYKNFDSVVESEVTLTPYMRDALLESEAGGDLAYWLGSNPDEAERIAGLSPIAQVKALALIESKLAVSEQPAKPQPRVTKAPEPIKPVGGNAPALNGFRETMTQAEYESWRASSRASGGGWS